MQNEIAIADENKVGKSLYWPAWLADAVEEVAAERGRSFSKYVELLARRDIAAIRRRKAAARPEPTEA